MVNKHTLPCDKLPFYSFEISSAGISYELFNYLLDKACVPFFESLQKWIYEGIIHDPYDEVITN